MTERERQAERARTEALIRAIRVISAGGHDLDATLDALVEQTRGLLDAPDATINLRDPDTGQYVRRRASILARPGSPQSLVGTAISLSEAAREALAAGHAVLVEDFQHDPRVGAGSRAALPSATGMLIVPLVDDDEPVGMMAARWTDRRRIDPRDVELVEALGRHAAVAVRSARLVSKVRREAERHRLVSAAARATVWEWGPESGEVVWDGPGMELFGYARTATSRVEWLRSLFHPSDRDEIFRPAQDALAGGADGYEQTFRLRRADGSYAHSRAVARIVRGGNGGPTRVMGILMDVTALRTAEDERDRLAEALTRSAERERVAMDLHDGAVQQLFGANLALASAARGAQTDPVQAINQAQAIVTAVSTSLRQYMEGLLSPTESTDLEASITAAVDGLLDAGAEVTTRVDSAAARTLEPRAVEHFGYVVREAVSNALRHGRARTISVEVRSSRDRTVLVIRDDGVGFDRPSIGGGRGLANMRRRATVIGGRLTITSRPGRGTTVHLAIPIAS